MFVLCQLSVIEGKNEEPSEEHDITSHFKPICAAIYNDLFDQVIVIAYPKATPKGFHKSGLNHLKLPQLFFFMSVTRFDEEIG